MGPVHITNSYKYVLYETLFGKSGWMWLKHINTLENDGVVQTKRKVSVGSGKWTGLRAKGCGPSGLRVSGAASINPRDYP